MEQKELYYGGELKDRADEGIQRRINITKDLLERSFGNLCNNIATYI